MERLRWLLKKKSESSDRGRSLSLAMLTAIKGARASLVPLDGVPLHALVGTPLKADASAAVLLSELAEATQAACRRLEEASATLAETDLHGTDPVQWEGAVVARDAALQDATHLIGLHIAGLGVSHGAVSLSLMTSDPTSDPTSDDPTSDPTHPIRVRLRPLPPFQAKRQHCQMALASSAGQEASVVFGGGAAIAIDAVDAIATDETYPDVVMASATANAALAAKVADFDAVGMPDAPRIEAIAAGIAQEEAVRQPQLAADVASCDQGLRELEHELAAVQERHQRRLMSAELLTALTEVAVSLKAAESRAKDARRAFEDVCDPDEPDLDDPEVAEAAGRRTARDATVQGLRRQRDGLVNQVAALSSRTSIQPSDVPNDAAEGWEQDFPDLPVLALRTMKRFKSAKSTLKGLAKTRHEAESLLRRDGLLVEGRAMTGDRSDYDRDDVPDILVDATQGKPNVIGARLKGAHGQSLKILKSIPLASYKQLKRAIITAHRLQHPGVVPVECAFVEGGDVVLQSRFYSGGNARQWCQEKSFESKLVAARRIAEAVQFLHSKGVIHRDVKPENIVFDGDTDAALPALCDFDISVDTQQTMTATVAQGTLLYMAPEHELAKASDIFALGVTLYDLVCCDGDLQRIPTTPSPLGPRFNAIAAMAAVGSENSIAPLLGRMVSQDPSLRPTAAHVTAELVAIVDRANHRDCCVCFERHALRAGVECGRPEPHFSCDGCLSGDLLGRQIPAFQARNIAITCCACRTPLERKSAIKHMNNTAYVAFQAKIEELRTAMMERKLADRLDEETKKLLELSRLDLAVLSARKHIENEIMTLQCPNKDCRRAFVDFSNCAALTCKTDDGSGCGKTFCGFCLIECPGDAHAHAGRCPKSPPDNRQRGIFPDRKVWNRVMDELKRDKLRVYWAQLEADVQAALAWDPSVRAAFETAKLPPPPLPYAAQMAQLRGMGFSDVAAMRAALQRADGDVDAALVGLRP